MCLGQPNGAPVDLHAHFLTGDPSWYTNIMEPSLRGASEAHGCFLPCVVEAAEQMEIF